MKSKLALSIFGMAAAITGNVSAALYTDGHADFGVGYHNGELDFHFHAGGATVDGYELEDELAISEVVTVVSTAAIITLPDGFAALGAGSGQSVWILPQSQDVMLPFLGLATEELPTAQWSGITFSLGNVTSPSGSGNFALWQNDVFGNPLIRMSTADPAADIITLNPGTHAHYNWGFTEAGIWEIEMTVAGTHVIDGYKQATETLTFHVIPEPSSMMLVSAAVGLAAFRRRRI